jgi:hypothetical protein
MAVPIINVTHPCFKVRSVLIPGHPHQRSREYELYCVQYALSYLSLQCDEIEVKGNGQRKQASRGEINKK